MSIFNALRGSAPKLHGSILLSTSQFADAGRLKLQSLAQRCAALADVRLPAHLSPSSQLPRSPCRPRAKGEREGHPGLAHSWAGAPPKGVATVIPHVLQSHVEEPAATQPASNPAVVAQDRTDSGGPRHFPTSALTNRSQTRAVKPGTDGLCRKMLEKGRAQTGHKPGTFTRRTTATTQAQVGTAKRQISRE